VVQIQLEEGDKLLSPATEETNILQGVVEACLARPEGAALDQLQHLKLEDLLFQREVLPPITPIGTQDVVIHQLVRVGDSAHHFREVSTNFLQVATLEEMTMRTVWFVPVGNLQQH